jgi:hypothetical protein
MRTETAQKGKYHIVKVLEDVTFHDNPAKLRHIVADIIAAGGSHVAFIFTPDTNPASRLISTIVGCSRLLQERGGQLVIVETDDSKRETFEILKLAHGKALSIAKSVDELA